MLWGSGRNEIVFLEKKNRDPQAMDIAKNLPAPERYEDPTSGVGGWWSSNEQASGPTPVVGRGPAPTIQTASAGCPLTKGVIHNEPGASFFNRC